MNNKLLWVLKFKTGLWASLIENNTFKLYAIVLRLNLKKGVLFFEILNSENSFWKSKNNNKEEKILQNFGVSKPKVNIINFLISVFKIAQVI